MAQAKSDAEHIAGTRNVPRFFVENRSVSAVALIALLVIGIASYRAMPKQKDPTIPTRVASVVTPWPGIDAEKVELLVTKPIENVIAQNSAIQAPGPNTYGIKSITLPGLSLIRVQLADDVALPEKEFNDINLRLMALPLPAGAGPIRFNSGFGETDALMLTIASPRERETALALRARSAADALRASRANTAAGEHGRTAVFLMFPRGAPSSALARSVAEPAAKAIEERGIGRDARVIRGDAFVAIDAEVPGGPAALSEFVRSWATDVLHAPSFHPDAWRPLVVSDPGELAAAVAANAGPKYTYAQLQDFGDLISRGISDVPQVSKVLSSGVLQERVQILYSQIQLAALRIPLAVVADSLAQRNTGLSGGTMRVGEASIMVTPTGEFETLGQIGDVIVSETQSGSPVYVRDFGSPWRTYQSPPNLLNYYVRKNEHGEWTRSPAITLGVQLRVGQQIADFGARVERTLEQFRERLPEDLIIARTSDQPRQVRENISLFLEALYEAIALVVLVALIGFLDWRASLLMMISIPLTLLMTFAFANALGIEIQQVTIATLIIALGLLVDDPVVAGDAIKRGLADGQTRVVAAWLGPTKLATAILFATLTNIIAYLPFVMLPGTTGEYLFSLPVVMACALVSSRLVSMTFIPLLGYFLLRKPRHAEPSIEDRRSRGISGLYYRAARQAMHHRWLALGVFVALMLGGFSLFTQLKRSFFPLDVQYLSTVDVWLPNDSGIYHNNDVVREVEKVIQRTADEAHERGDIEGELLSISSFVGGSGPRFWQTIKPKLSQPNYSQLILEVENKDDTPALIPILQAAVAEKIPGAWVDAHQLQTNPIEYPVAFRISGRAVVGETGADRDIEKIRELGNELATILREAPSADRVRTDWLDEQFGVTLNVDQDRASLSGIDNRDFSLAVQAAYDGVVVGTLRDGDKRIPVEVRMLRAERPDVSRLGELYVYPANGNPAVPLGSIADVDVDLGTGRIRRLDHFRTITVLAYPRIGMLASDVTGEILDDVEAFAQTLPPGYELTVSGELSKQTKGFRQLLIVLAVSAAGIFVALVLQFRHIVKPFMVLAGVPFGFAGGITGLWLMGASFSFMAFLGLVSLVGVIVSHIIIIFDFIEKMHERGEPFEDAVLDAGIMRLRPVFITVAATVLALLPLARHGGPLWQPLCYAQIGGLTVATAISLLIIPVIYAICVEDLKIVRWSSPDRVTAEEPRSS